MTLRSYILGFAMLSSLLLQAWPAGATESLKVSSNKRFLVRESGAPFFWLGDTAWRLQTLAPADVDAYLDHRRKNGFNVIQGPVLTREEPSYEGQRNDDPANPNERFFKHIDYIVRAADARGLYIAPVVIWGNKLQAVPSTTVARDYGRYLGARYKDRANIIWIVGGEYGITSTSEEANRIWQAIAKGLQEGSGGQNLLTIHPSWSPERLQTSSTYFQNAPWLAFNMIQSSQGGNRGSGAANWRLVESDYGKVPAKPTLDAEATYESARWNDFGVRRRAYWSVFAGGFGTTYGADGVMNATAEWRSRLDLPGALQMTHLKALMESRPVLSRVPDQEVFTDKAGGVPDHIQATRDASGAYAMVYIPRSGYTIHVNSGKLSGTKLRAWWFDPRNGKHREIGTVARTGTLNFTTPSGPDWVLVLDDASKNYAAPGSRP